MARSPCPLLLALAALLAVPLAAAHAELVSSDPPAGARLGEPPADVLVVLSEGIEPSAASLTVADAQGRRVDLDDLAIEDPDGRPRLTVSLQPGLPDGPYTMTWKVLSKDTHTVTGHVTFGVGVPAPALPGGPRDGPSVNLDSAVARTLLYGGYALAFGAAAMVLWLRRDLPAMEPLLPRTLLAAGVLHTAGMALLLHVTARSSGLGLGGLLDSGVGRNMYLRLLLGIATAVLVLVSRRSRTAMPMAVALLAASAGATAINSHAFKAGPATVVIDLIHLVAGAAWVGSLALLLWSLYGAGHGLVTAGEARHVGRRFGTLALGCVLLLAFTGIIGMVVVAGPDALLHPLGLLGSPYGRFLLAKVGLAAAMVGVASVNRYVLLEAPGDRGLSGQIQRVARRLSGGRLRPLLEGEEARSFRRGLRVEAAMGAVVLVLAGFLTSLSPPTAAEAPSSLTLRGDGEAHTVALRIDPAPQEGVRSHLGLTIHETASGAVVGNHTCGRDSCVLLDVAYAGQGGAERHVAVPDGQGGWSVHGVLWARAGTATVTVEVSTATAFRDQVALQVPVA